MTRFIDDHRDRFGVTPICDVLGWNVSTYYAHRRRPPSERALRDDHLAVEIRRVFEANYHQTCWTVTSPPPGPTAAGSRI